MKHVLIILLALLVLSVATGSAAVRDGEFGLGIVLGEPSGVLGQFFMSNNSLLDITAAWSFEGDGGLFAAVDYQIYENLGDAPPEWSWYYGPGGYVSFPEGGDGVLGFRIPLGIAYSFPNSPVDVWLELDPALQLVPETEGHLMGGIGITFWIK